MVNISYCEFLSRLFFFFLLASLAFIFLPKCVCSEDYVGAYNWKKETPAYNPGGKDFEKDADLVKRYNKKQIKEKKLKIRSEVDFFDKSKKNQVVKRNPNEVTVAMINKDGVNISELTGAKIVKPTKIDGNIDYSKDVDVKSNVFFSKKEEREVNESAAIVDKAKKGKKSTSNKAKTSFVIFNKKSKENKSKKINTVEHNNIQYDEVYNIDEKTSRINSYSKKDKLDLKDGLKKPSLKEDFYSTQNLKEINNTKRGLFERNKQNTFKKNKSYSMEFKRIAFYKKIKSQIEGKTALKKDEKKIKSKQVLTLHYKKEPFTNPNKLNDRSNDSKQKIRGKKIDTAKIQKNILSSTATGYTFSHNGIGYYENPLRTKDFYDAKKRAEQLIIIG